MVTRVLAPLAVDQAAVRCSYGQSVGNSAAPVSTTATTTRNVMRCAVKMSLKPARDGIAGMACDAQACDLVELAALRLAECLINARNFPDRGLKELARLARGVCSYELQYSEFSQLDTWVAQL